MHSIGNAISIAAFVAQRLVAFGYASIQKTSIHTEEVKREEGTAKKPKMIVILKRALDFKKKVEEFEKVMAKGREEREKQKNHETKKEEKASS